MASTENPPDTISWTASEYIDHQRGIAWYLLLIVATAGTAGVIYLITKDYFATGITIVLGLIAASAAHWKPRDMSYKLSSKGLHVGEKFYPYSQFRTFSIYHEGELSSLVFQPVKKFVPPLSAFIDKDDEQKISDLVGEHLPMAESSPDRVERISRRLRF